MIKNYSVNTEKKTNIVYILCKICGPIVFFHSYLLCLQSVEHKHNKEHQMLVQDYKITKLPVFSVF